MCMKRVWPSLLAAWLAGFAPYSCSVDQRSLGSLGAPQGEAGTAADVSVDGPLDGPLDGLPDSQDALAGETDAVAEVWVPFGSVSLFPPLASTPASQADPTLTADELELYFSSNPNTDWDIWLVQRDSSTGLWGTPSRVDQLSSPYLDETPEVSADGLTIYLASARPGDAAAGEHLWVSHRATRAAFWDPPVPVTDFVGGDTDLSPSLARDQLLMVFASLHGSDYDLYATTRASTADQWGLPTPLTKLNSPANDWDPALYQNGTSIVFASRRLNTANSLFYASRATVTDEFFAPQPATELNVNDDSDPWLSDDGHHIFFDSRRGGGPIKIYQASR
jgi:Tol biopolymer transport system component